MKAPEKKWTIYCIHHSHTDIGYTDLQEELEYAHVEYIQQVLDILQKEEQGKTEWSGFRWNCESAWCVEKFLEQADEAEKTLFFRYVKEGKIGVSGSYLNLTELVNDRALREKLKQFQGSMAAGGVSVRSAMTADINGYSWGFAGVLLESGVENLLSCVHTHHGQYPVFEKQRPFYWVAPNGKKLFVWVGEHYHMGNELGLAQQEEGSYMIRDGLPQMEDRFLKAELRLYAYVRTMEEQGYAFDFAPMAVSGMMTDNSPPSAKVIEFIHAFNEKHGTEIELKMATLQEFFDVAREKVGEIPEYAGDWTDWWADGVGSTPNIVSHYREASRIYNMLPLLDPDGAIVSEKEREAIRYNLIFYSEHTWGHSASVGMPWYPGVNELDLRKSLFAQKANELARRALCKILAKKGKTTVHLGHDYCFRVVNPHDTAVQDMACINMETLYGHEYFRIVDAATGEEVACQTGLSPRGKAVYLAADLGPGEERTYRIEDTEAPPLISSGRQAEWGADQVVDFQRAFDVRLARGSCASPFGMENRFLKIRFEEGIGITSLYDKVRGVELCRPGAEAAFQPVYEVTPIRQNPLSERREMGRNRKAVHTRRDFGRMTHVQVLKEGQLYSRVEMGYDLAGAGECGLTLTLHHRVPRLDVAFHLHKESVWAPENLYLALPFNACNGKDTVWMDKSGCMIRPRVDQLPGSCADFYLLENGIAIQKEQGSVLIGLKDTPLVAMGDIKAHPIRLCGEAGMENDDRLYAWLMNNFWETNFKVSLGGFHQYHFTLALTDERDPECLFKQLGAVNGGVLGFYSFE